jgi:hypothetical protein
VNINRFIPSDIPTNQRIQSSILEYINVASWPIAVIRHFRALDQQGEIAKGHKRIMPALCGHYLDLKSEDRM